MIQDVTDQTILDCGHVPSPHSECTTGYGRDHEGKTLCYACCAQMDREQMIRDGKASLYLSKRDDGTWVINWPGSLLFPVTYMKEWRGWGFGGWYPVQLAYFTGPDGKEWSIKVQGDQQLGRARRLKG